MKKEELMFYNEYEMFYEMADQSEVFKKYCERAFEADFSQDGFSDFNQINFILDIVSLNKDSRVLDIGCGNAKMLKYVQEKTGAYIEGFDFSEKAIETARKNANDRCSFQVGIIGDIDFEPEQFDLITSMDTIYFSKDMKTFVMQIYGWLKYWRKFYLWLSGGRYNEKDFKC